MSTGLRHRASTFRDDVHREKESSLSHKLSKLDMYPKLAKRGSRFTNIKSAKTQSGALLSVLSWILIAYLVIGEVSLYIQPAVLEHLGVDKSGSQEKITASFNITFPAIPCPDLRVDAQDITREQEINVIQTIRKQRLSIDGELIGKPYTDRQETEEYKHIPGLGIMKLRNTEMQVHLSNEGCNIFGNLLLRKVAGNFHVALGKSVTVGRGHVHHFNISDMKHFNTSHIIHNFNMGSNLNDRFNEPLSGWKEILIEEEHIDHHGDGSESEYTGHFEYFLQIVPTSYESQYGLTRSTFQYSMTKQFTRVEPHHEKNIRVPGIFFIYKISPFVVTYREESRGFLHLITNLCAVAGGVVTVTGIIDGFIFHFSRMSNRPQRRGSELPSTL